MRKIIATRRNHEAGADRQRARIKPAKKKNMLFKFLTIVLICVGSFSAVGALAAVSYIHSVNASAKPYLDHLAEKEKGMLENLPGTNPSEPLKSETGNETDGFLEAPRKTNFLILGIDVEASLSDVMIVGCFDRETAQIDLINIPRDTYIVMPKNTVKALQEAGRRPPSSGVMKLNSVHSYAGPELGAEYVRQEIESLLGIDINYYIEVDTKAFRSVVDAVGGVDIEVPAGGMYYSDPLQNLNISIPGGMQHLDGKQAEGFVRFRATYPGGDLQRIEVQQKFLKELFKQVLNKDTIMGNLPSFLSTVITYVKTDFPLTDVPKYLKLVDKLDPNKFDTYRLPGEAQSLPVGDGEYASYYMMDSVEVKALVKGIFYNTEIPDENAVSTVADKDLRVQILNGGYTKGLAAEKKEMLEANGFAVSNIDTYSGSKTAGTRIMVRDMSYGDRFLDYFEGAAVEKDSALPTGFDVVIILGTDEE